MSMFAMWLMIWGQWLMIWGQWLPKPKAMTVERIRGRKLQRIRAAHFIANPLCVMCEAQGMVTQATELDHIIALTNGGANDDSNLQGLCDACHDIKTARDLGYTPRTATGLDGWPIPAETLKGSARWRR